MQRLFYSSYWFYQSFYYFSLRHVRQRSPFPHSTHWFFHDHQYYYFQTNRRLAIDNFSLHTWKAHAWAHDSASHFGIPNFWTLRLHKSIFFHPSLWRRCLRRLPYALSTSSAITSSLIRRIRFLLSVGMWHDGFMLIWISDSSALWTISLLTLHKRDLVNLGESRFILILVQEEMDNCQWGLTVIVVG